MKRIRLLPGKDNPRNSEGDFIELADGRILFVYTHFTGGQRDHSAAHLAGRFSSDGGRTWTENDVTILPNEGKLNVMSCSLLRMQTGEIALFYARKNSATDCRPYMRISTDEAKTWGEPTLCIDTAGYYVLNNDRAVQLHSGRIVLPVALHNAPGSRWDPAGAVMCCLSDDAGMTWRRSRTQLLTRSAQGGRITTQEPGVVELADGRLMMFCRTESGSQYVSFSDDGGETWPDLQPSNMVSPLSPASIKRIPATGDLLLVWNDHSNVPENLRGKRTPLCVALSRDEAGTWENVRTLEDDPDGWYCYTAIAFVGDDVLLSYCAGDESRDKGLTETQLTRFPLEWLYGRR